jgi:hypothetical protein
MRGKQETKIEKEKERGKNNNHSECDMNDGSTGKK